MAGIETEVIPADNLVAAHLLLGEVFRADIERAARGRCGRLSKNRFKRQLLCARRSRFHSLQRAGRTPSLRKAVTEYFDSLHAWARGAGLMAVFRRLCPPSKDPIELLDFALWLQDDTGGCQTGMLRTEDGGVLFWHTEEDTVGYCNRPKIVHFKTPGFSRCAFLYPYLLPGPAFGWGEHYFYAVDSLTIRREGSETGAFTALASWLVWRLAARLSLKQMIRYLAPFVDACAINVLHQSKRRVYAEKIEFGERQQISGRLPARTDSFMFQVNEISDPSAALARLELMSSASHKRYQGRKARTESYLHRVLASRKPKTLESLEALLSSRTGGQYAYANEDVKGYAAGILRRTGPLLLAVGGVPLMKNETLRPSWHGVRNIRR